MRSRYSDGNVPTVNWNDDKVNVNWNDHGNADPNIGTRQTVFAKYGGLSARRLRT